jgi:hypothetical protein
MTDDDIFNRWNAFSITLDMELSQLFEKADLDDDQKEHLEELTDQFRDEAWQFFHSENDEGE